MVGVSRASGVTDTVSVKTVVSPFVMSPLRPVATDLQSTEAPSFGSDGGCVVTGSIITSSESSSMAENNRAPSLRRTTVRPDSCRTSAHCLAIQSVSVTRCTAHCFSMLQRHIQPTQRPPRYRSDDCRCAGVITTERVHRQYSSKSHKSRSTAICSPDERLGRSGIVTRSRFAPSLVTLFDRLRHLSEVDLSE